MEQILTIFTIGVLIFGIFTLLFKNNGINAKQSLEEQTSKPKPGSIMPWDATLGKRWTIIIRRGTQEKWVEFNPILRIYEPGFEEDTGKIKVGDGRTAWKDLPYCDSLQKFLNYE